MTNAEKFKTAKEREVAFREFCQKNRCDKCPAYRNLSDNYNYCTFVWQDLEAPLTASEVADILAKYIAWRKGDHGQPSPCTWEELNTVIDRAVEILQNVKE